MNNALKQRLKNFLNKVYLPLAYRFFCPAKPVTGRVLFVDTNTFSLPESMELVHEYYKKEGYDIALKLANVRELSLFSLLGFLTSLMKEYARAQYVYICNYCLPINSCSKRKETKVIQLWHSCGMLKKFAYDAKDDISDLYHGSVTKNIDLITVSAPCCVDVFRQAFRLKGKRAEIVKATGISRTDRFFDSAYNEDCRKEFFKRYPQYKGKKIILWAPTFRGTAAEAKLVGREGIKALKARLPDDCELIVRLHPQMKEKFTNCEIPTERLFACADLLITDFSSLCYEFALYAKPIVIYAPDYDEYVHERGLYSDISEAGEIVRDSDRLFAAVTELIGKKSEKSRSFAEKYCLSCDGKSTPRIIKTAHSL